jgi:hypothetical protein
MPASSPSRSEPSSTPLRFRSTYALISIVVLNTIALFAVVNLAAAAWLRLQADEPVKYDRAWLIDGYGLDTLARNYPGMSREDVTTLLYETSNWVQEYEAFTGFRPVTRRDRFITISPDGFRPVPQQASWPPPTGGTTIFLFGGSTMMGAGVPDDATIAAHLRTELASCRPQISIYNFGRGFYFSSQERILFEQLLLAGHRPTLAVFFDGLNDFYFADGVPQYTQEMTSFMKRSAGLPDDPSLSGSLASAARQLPITRLAAKYLVTPEPPPSFGQAPPDSGRPDEERIAGALSRWERNRDMIRATAAASNIRAAFVWQPVPTYGYDQTKLTVYRDGVDLFGAHKLSGLGYPEAARRYRDGKAGRDVLWLGDIQRNRAENLYVDAVHYTNEFSADIARLIGRFLTTQGLIPCSARTNGE